LEYEIPKYDGDLGTPNFYVPFSRKIADRKIKFLMDCFGTQRDKRWFTRDTFQGLMRIRGVEVNEIGRASCRERVKMLGVGVALKMNKRSTGHETMRYR